MASRVFCRLMLFYVLSLNLEGFSLLSVVALADNSIAVPPDLVLMARLLLAAPFVLEVCT